MDMQVQEYISALADGALDDSEIAAAFALLDTLEGRAAWDSYHQIGHVLRQDGCGFELSSGFSARLRSRLAEERMAPANLRQPESSATGMAIEDGAAVIAFSMS